MLLTELDGFLTGLVVCPEAVPADEWMTIVWGADVDGVPPFDDPLDVQWFTKAVAARRYEVSRDLARGRLQPIFDIAERDGEVLWEYWVDGFAEAIALRPTAWDALATDPDWAASWHHLGTLIAIAHEESGLDSIAINAMQDRVADDLPDIVQRLYAARARIVGSLPAVTPASALKVGRNDPCPCGSAKKHKHCCG